MAIQPISTMVANGRIPARIVAGVVVERCARQRQTSASTRSASRAGPLVARSRALQYGCRSSRSGRSSRTAISWTASAISGRQREDERAGHAVRRKSQGRRPMPRIAVSMLVEHRIAGSTDLSRRISTSISSGRQVVFRHERRRSHPRWRAIAGASRDGLDRRAWTGGGRTGMNAALRRPVAAECPDRIRRRP